MDTLRFSESIVVARSPEFLYDMISDVTRMGEWSPVCKACWWDDGRIKPAAQHDALGVELDVASSHLESPPGIGHYEATVTPDGRLRRLTLSA